MALEVGSRLGHYDVTALIGEGGMGQVYRATDTQLGRDVALKILPDAFAADPDRLARFQREAQILASLNHPNIAAIHGIEEAEGTRALVLELVEGPTLADRIAKGAIPLDEALPIAKQIAEALDAAHEAGVIHRDLKPANIKVREDGTVKVLDFGLAKALDPEPQGDPSESPTLTAAATQMGVIMGTAAYMSPEQARGRPLDKRADIWAFGAVLFEMLTGRMAFGGDDISSTLAKVIEREPDFSLLPDATPAPVEGVLRRCLTKARKRRLRDIGDVQIELGGTVGRPGARDSAPGLSVGVPVLGRRAYAAWAATAVVAAIVAGALAWSLNPASEPPLRKSERLVEGVEQFAGFSPDGRRLLYMTNEGLWTWSLDELAPREVRDQDGGSLTTEVEGGLGNTAFWSPDGRHIAFADGDRLLRVPAAGGPVTVICETPDLLGILAGAWSENDTIVFAQWRGDLFEVAASGGTPQLYLARDPDTEVDFHSVRFLPQGRGVLYSVHAREGGHVGVFSNGTRRVLVDDAVAPSYSPSGHLVYMDRAGDILSPRIWAVAFDPDDLAVTGAPFVVASGLSPTVSSDGTLSYVRTPEAALTGQLVWLDRNGTEIGTVGQPQVLAMPAISPDGRRIAVYALEDRETGVWIYDVTSGTRVRVATWDGGPSGRLAWFPDGSEVLYAPREGDQFFNDLEAVRADGSREPRIVVSGNGRNRPRDPSFSRDGRYMAYTQGEQEAVRSLWMRALDDAASTEAQDPVPFVTAPGDNSDIVLSPSGSHAAYVAVESGTQNIYLTQFPSGEGRWRVSSDGGVFPRWRADGRELFYFLEGRLMAVPIATEPAVTVGVPEELFGLPDDVLWDGYDVSADGTRFVMVRNADDPTGSLAIAVVQNWFAEFAATQE